MFVTNWISTTKIQKISEITNFFRHYFLSRTEVKTDLIAGSNYPLQLTPQEVALQIVNAIERGKTVKTIDWKYSILVSLWRMIPRWIWTRLTIK